MSRRPRARQVVDLVVDKVGGYMIGNIIISLIAGVVSFIAFTILGVQFEVPLAFVVAICDLIPMIGATLGAAIGVTVVLFSADLWPTHRAGGGLLRRLPAAGELPDRPPGC